GSSMTVKPETIEEMLKSIGLLTAWQIKDALRSQRNSKERLGLILLQKGYIKDENITSIVATQLGINIEETQHLEIKQDIIRKVSAAFAHHHRVIPIKHNNDILTIATDNPFNFLAFGNFKFLLGCKIEGVLTKERDMDELLERYYGIKNGAFLDVFVAGMDEDKKAALEGAGKEKAPASKEEETPVVKLVSLLIGEALKKRASDVHIEPLENKFRIRYRIDGVLHEMPGPPKRLQASVISRVKIMAGMDIAEKRLAQDGRIRLEIGGREIDLRVSTLPAIYGESVVLRILDKSSYLLGLNDLGFDSEDEKRFKKLIRIPNGILLVTGPTGSGKTTTLYASLNHINKSDRKIITIEDPVEYQMTGINQVQVRPQINLTFATGLRNILRQAPDVIMVGEIRDFEAAQIAIQAALTGHLVFSTLHTNDAPGAVTRLIDMGVKPYLVASALQAVLAQRLVRVICPSCKEEYKPTETELNAIKLSPEQLRNAKFRTGRGCEECANTGYKGRKGIFELLIMTGKIRELVFEKAPSSILKEKARALGMATLRDDGIRKVLSGTITISEMIRVTQQDAV
ncbi:MAG: type II secretion system ATPase GspE, partial [Candidatus Omnitrophota bacterium]|nr:type II secretion system ATPase GspE [Candidatus Omnitrophota bacterium]